MFRKLHSWHVARIPPAYSRHSGTNLARVRIDGRVIYLGVYGSPESKARYSELVADWMAEQGTSYRNCPRLSVAKVAVAFVKRCRTYYRTADGRETSEVQAIRDALKHLNAVAGKEEASRIGPRHLKAVQKRLIEKGLARTTHARGKTTGRLPDSQILRVPRNHGKQCN